ncbi:MAG: pilin [Candidatus Gracilibacteria bacterium]|jgi:hypothetical protein
MQRIKKILIILALFGFGSGIFSTFAVETPYTFLPVTHAAAGLLPEAKNCETLMTTNESWEEDIKKADADYAAILGCAIQNGEVHFWMLPYFVKYILGFVVSLSGLVIVLMIIVGAYYYIAGGLTDDKEKGKTIIKYALYGFVLILCSWTLVNVLLLALTT